MKKRKAGLKLSRAQGARRALYRSLVRALVEHGSITSTKAKVKFIQARVEKLINLAKKGGVANQRRVSAVLGNDRKITQLVSNAASVFKDIKGGYTRAVNLPRRRGDAAEMARLEWTEEVGIKDLGKSDKSNKKSKKPDTEKVKAGRLKDALKKVRSKK